MSYEIFKQIRGMQVDNIKDPWKITTAHMFLKQNIQNSHKVSGMDNNNNNNNNNVMGMGNDKSNNNNNNKVIRMGQGSELFRKKVPIG